MKRRDFLYRTGMVSLPFLINGTRLSTLGDHRLMNHMESDSDRALVLVQLHGGNDGLNTLIPLDQYDNLVQVRQNIIIPEQELLHITDKLAFHPSMSGMKGLFEQGYLGAIQDVSYPNQNRSHFRSKDIWTSASSSEELVSEGWLGRILETDFPNFPMGYPNDQEPDPFAITIGHIVSETCQGLRANFSYTLDNPEGLGQLDSPVNTVVDNSCFGQELNFIRTAIEQSNAYAGSVGDAYEKGQNLVDYSLDSSRVTGLYKQLQIVSRLISGGLKTKIFVVSMGGFDTHANQVIEGEPSQGEHSDLLAELSGAIALFQEDLVLQSMDHRVLGMTFSEFGRQIKSNDSFGTDHGSAAPLFVFGSCVQANILGHNPEIDPNVSDSAGVPMQYDFRSVYGTLLTDWMGVDESTVKTIIFNDFQRLPILEGCESIVSNDDLETFFGDIKIFPNPVRNELKINLTVENGEVQIMIFDVVGKSMIVPIKRNLIKGIRTLTVDVSQIQAGTYHVRIQDGIRVASKRFVKV